MKTLSRLSLLALILFFTAACMSQAQGSSTGTTNQQQPAEPARISAATGTYFSINEVGLGPNGFVALTNFTDVPASLAGLYLCQEDSCFELPDTVVDAGETVRIAVGNGNGIENAVAKNATLGELRSSDGEVALLASTRLNDSDEILVYFQWGSTPHKLTQTAIDAGLWVKGGYGPSSENATRLFKVPESGLWLFEEP